MCVNGWEVVVGFSIFVDIGGGWLLSAVEVS